MRVQKGCAELPRNGGSWEVSERERGERECAHILSHTDIHICVQMNTHMPCLVPTHIHACTLWQVVVSVLNDTVNNSQDVNKV